MLTRFNWCTLDYCTCVALSVGAQLVESTRQDGMGVAEHWVPSSTFSAGTSDLRKEDGQVGTDTRGCRKHRQSTRLPRMNAPSSWFGTGVGPAFMAARNLAAVRVAT